MTDKKGSTLKNSFKDEVDESVEERIEIKKPKKRNPAKVEPTPSGAFQKARDFFNDEKTQRISGAVFLLLSAYFAIAFTSFLFTWQNDSDKVKEGLFSLLANTDVRVENWLGKLGAVISHQFIHNGFGISAYLFVVVFLVAGVKLFFRQDILPFGKTLSTSLFFLLWVSLALGYFSGPGLRFLGGTFGYQLNTILGVALGGIGTLFLITFSLLIYLIVVYNFSFKFKSNTPVEYDDVSPVSEVVKPTEEEKVVEDLPINSYKQEEPINNTVEFTTTEIKEEKKNEIELEPEIKKPESTDNVEFIVEKIEEPTVEVSETEKEQLPFGEYDSTLDLSSYQYPPLDLLMDYGNKTAGVNSEELNANKDRILKTLGDYGIEIEKIKATIGPTVTLYEIIPAAGVRISKIKNLEDDIALSLSALGIRIIAPIPGKGTIGIEVPNQTPEMVPMKAILSSEKFQNCTMDLPIALGKTVSNEIYITDLSKMPHLLMAGATGQGKSVGLNAILVSLLYKKHPSQVKFVLVDPKKVELTLFNIIERHFLAKLPDAAEPIITDTKKVVHTLNSLCIEMDQRYELLKEAGVRNIKEYNTKFVSRKLNPNNGHKFLPYIVLVVDEFADLIMTAGREVETPIARLAQLARAIGIHLIIATQRPSVNIITGTIKANFPARIAFRVTSKIDSRTILDSGGADQLIGRGDMLLSTGNELIRIQCAFVDTPEVEKITEFIGGQRGYPSAFLLPEYIDESSEGGAGEDMDPSERDKLFGEAAKIVVMSQQGSASMLQRKLKLGYNRAGRIVDQLEAAGIIGPFEGSKAREVLIKDPASLEQILNKE